VREMSVPLIRGEVPRTTSWSPKEVDCIVGLAEGDITPPIGIRAHNWGASRTGQALGVHRPLRAGVLALRSEGDIWRYLITVDLGWWQSIEVYSSVYDPVVRAVGADRSSLLLHLVHTHSGPSLAETDSDLPGSELVEPYRRRLVDTIVDLVSLAKRKAERSTITWAYGKCDMAVVRDLPCGPRYILGFNSAVSADDTVAVGRVVGPKGGTRAVLVNYACHPTTLAYENSLFSPDFIGATREVVEEKTRASCFFYQGASGDLAPREQYLPGTDDVDRHGRSLGYAVLATLENMGTPSTTLEFQGVVESGAPLALWSEELNQPSSALNFDHEEVRLKCRSPKSESQLIEQWHDVDPLAARERVARAARLAEGYDSNGWAQHPLWIWRLGDAVFVAHPGEAYSLLQSELRRRHPEFIIFVLNLTNGPGFMYLPTKTAYQDDRYQVWQTLLEEGSLESLIEAADSRIQRLSSKVSL
jgi:hypothetical protein